MAFPFSIITRGDIARSRTRQQPTMAMLTMATPMVGTLMATPIVIACPWWIMKRW